MSTPEVGPEHGGRWWAALDDDALQAEVTANRRAERWVAVAGLAGVVLTALVLLVVAAAR
ncbi:hypothetical protein [Cellulomonas sp. S1-8]|uniref:hypothetical protein n=1 Tax=Cellulomonas sp. S1-8 TaxID=2904790 RepID=UPI0022448B97|nr:hypothetical protein [Cellulomonas sp. S1-8]UZN04637.1 hypothetical protein OKX07_06910 [Cellulomonas sp. S1-8]